ncbi:MAG: hypothetical protein G01um101433_381 [Parcubacteria group bacterium Gr01-1014_33]|nr:MAG: hypothetical protein G01um101433_381 [Parcubacteria group bacterium Gr01-1014_33]
MQLHQLQPIHRGRKARRVGRGGKRGTYSGRGIKGLGARAGGKFRPPEREILKKIPKLRGYRFKSFRRKPAIVNLFPIESHFKEGEIVSPVTLLKRGLIAKTKGNMPKVKILGKGELTKKLVFKDVMMSHAVTEKVKL